MIILGVDTGTVNIGIAVYCSDSETILHSIVQNFKAIGHWKYYQEFYKLLKNYKPDMVVFEQPFHNKFGAPILEVLGVQKLACDKLKIPCTTICATTVKKVTCGSGKADKVEVASKVKELMGFSSKINHLTDAAAIAYSWYIKHNTLV